MLIFIIVSIIIMIISSRISEIVEEKLNRNKQITSDEEKLLDAETINILKNYGLIRK